MTFYNYSHLADAFIQSDLQLMTKPSVIVKRQKQQEELKIQSSHIA